MKHTAKLFMNGRSQAVRLPKAFRFDCDEVYVTKQGKGCCLLAAISAKGGIHFQSRAR